MKTQIKNAKSLVGRTLNYKVYGTRGNAMGFYSLRTEETGVVKKHTEDGHVYYGADYSVALPKEALNELNKFGLYRVTFPGKYGMMRVEIRID